MAAALDNDNNEGGMEGRRQGNGAQGAPQDRVEGEEEPLEMQNRRESGFCLEERQQLRRRQVAAVRYDSQTR